MTQYMIYFNQQWVGDHSAEWFAQREPLANAVVEELRDAGEYVFAAGVDEDLTKASTADATSGTLEYGDGPYAPGQQYISGLTIVDVVNEARARFWAGKIAEACGWPQATRRVY